jgi:Tfp pilus assembly protein PilE
MRKVSGLTLLELLVGAAIFAMVSAALSRAFWFAIHYEINAPAERERFESQIRFEDRMRAILQQAYISSSATDLSTYLIGTEGGQNPNGSPNLTAATAAPGTAAASSTTAATASSSSGANTSGTSDGIVLTVLGQQIPPNYLAATGVSMTDTSGNTSPTGGTQDFEQSATLANGQSAESDLEQLNTDYGPQGGVTEIAISLSAVGDPGQYSGDLYIRTQHPADADYTQGGTERVLDDSVQKIQFEFYDGTNWDGGWDTTSSGMHYLPAAIRVHYWLKADPDTEHVFVVRLPLSTLTPQSPLGSASTGTSTVTGGTGTGGGGTGGTGGTGRGGAALTPLPGVLPLFSNLQIQPEASADAPLDPKALLSPNSLDALSANEKTQDIAPPTVSDWQKQPGPFQYVPKGDPLIAPTTPTNLRSLSSWGRPRQAPSLQHAPPSRPSTVYPLPSTLNPREGKGMPALPGGAQ